MEKISPNADLNISQRTLITPPGINSAVAGKEVKKNHERFEGGLIIGKRHLPYCCSQRHPWLQSPG